ncbi:unnamed protein product [Camellia sinensis]
MYQEQYTEQEERERERERQILPFSKAIVISSNQQNVQKIETNIYIYIYRERERERQRERRRRRRMDRESEMKQSKFKRVCVFCGSSQGKKSSYQDAAIELGKELVSRNIDLVYGGGSIGLMGLVSHAVHDGGRHVIGVIPKTLMPRELTGETVGEVKAVADMHQRKAEMAKHSDAFIALPGGYGTLEELLEVITWAQLGIHDKPVGLLNVDGYYNSLLSFIDKAVEEGFISPNARHIIVSAPTARELVKKLEEYVPRHERVASKLSWEIERLGYPQTFEISR